MNANTDDDRSSTTSTSSNESQGVWALMYEDKLPETTDPLLAKAIKGVFADFTDVLDIYCRANYTCCNSCGYAEIEDYLTGDEGGYKEDELNYVFFHIQETERLADGAKKVHLNHRLTEATKQRVLEYVKLPNSHLHWDGDEGKKIIISPYPLKEDD